MKTVYEMTHVKKVSAICLLNGKTKEHCGQIIANWSDNPNGAVVTAQVILHGNAPTAKSQENFINTVGTAGGYGYDKLSAAIAEALRKVGLEQVIKVEEAAGNQKEAFEAAGYIYIGLL